VESQTVQDNAPFKPNKGNLTWQRNAPGQITLNSIFAAMVGVLIALAIQDSIPDGYKISELGLLVLAFLFFAISAEQTTNALDENDVRKYVYYMIHYNAGVILTGVSVAIIIYAHFNRWLSCHLYQLFPSFYLTYVPLILFFAALTVALLFHWIKDFFWFFRTSTDKIEDYLDELEDKVKPEYDRSLLMGLYCKWKKLL